VGAVEVAGVGVVEAVSGDRAVQRIVAGWLARGHLIGASEEELRTLAGIATQAANAPQTWDVGEVVPREVGSVWDGQGLRWVRAGNGVWRAYAPESRLTDLVGPVTEDMDGDPPNPAPAENPSKCAAHGHEGCTWCAQTTPGGLEDGKCLGCEVYAETGMHWDTCPYRVRTAPPETDTAADECGARNPDYLLIWCDRPAGHSGDHANSREGTTWPAEAKPTGQQTVVLDRDAVVGLMALLESVGAKLTRVSTAYKGPPVKHAANLAAACTQSAALLRDVLGGEDA
jgi:hypothetical protein